MNLTEAIKESSFFSEEEVFLELVRSCSNNYHRNINAAYRRGMAKPCAQPIWDTIADQMRQTSSERTTHGVLSPNDDTTQEQWASELEIAQSTVSKWFASDTGSTELGNLVLGMTCFGIESISLAERDERILHGYIEALNITRSRELQLPKKEATRDVVYSIAELYQIKHGWLKARETEGRPGHQIALEEAAASIREAAKEKAGRELLYQEPEDFIELQKTWGKSWLIVIKCSPLVVCRKSTSRGIRNEQE